ncbi:TPA: hypothetical protein ACOEGY_002201 [Enterobacter bugandensis]|jgi:hypothetical protein|uniref:DUF4760 domain-containing protein n=1 Tax=Enterobacter bugandensis TaxID=881260 RepID=A0A822WUV4_9ENTR|nr:MULTISPECIES: hypothetical protein [Enterobacter]ELH8608227.1 hypothetical protein [Enterobacter asburiae]MBE4943767.1 hypothetical protein [Enterobacter cloacae complex sp. P1B]MBE4968482.1 hypothetical protein [Enterobacter cloacae complex sp. P11RS]MCK7089765.1 hypothetical protein [Enterobacter bugandensis]MCK7160341.1 hypothetical protein [Enterobacter bugandensis]
MAVGIAAQCDWFNLLTNGSLIPLSALVAICLFIIRELLDCYRKSQSKKNEIRALKKIFARECQLAWSVCVTIKELCEQFAPYEARPMNECPLNFSITRTTAGKTRYAVKENDNLSSGGVLNKPSVETFKKHLYDILKLDSSFYKEANSAFSAVIELQHFYESLVDNDDTAQLLGLNSVMYGFSGYAIEEIVWIERDIKGLYQYCTDEELTEGLLR